jgi:hypothetical protein
MTSTARLTWPQVHAWRLQRHFAGGSTVDVVRRLCGVQAQVMSAAELAVAVRHKDPAPEETLAEGMARGALVRTWAMRGTLHVLDPADAAAYLSLIAAARTWARPSWQRTFLSLDQVDRLTESVSHLLADDAPRTREELVAHVREDTGDEHLADQLGSSWAAALKPLAWQGLIAQGPPSRGPGQGTRVTFTRPPAAAPSWPGLLTADAAARHAIGAYLAVFGPATPAAFDAWLLRGATSKAALRRWFTDLGDALATVEVDGEPLLARAEDVDAMASTGPSDVVRLLPAFDQFVLGPGTGDPHLVPAHHRATVSRAAGWIAPVVATVHGVVGTWESASGGAGVSLFEDAPAPGRAALTREVARVEALLTRAGGSDQQVGT